MKKIMFNDRYGNDNSMLWKMADGPDLPDINREVIALTTIGKVVYAHRPSESWDGKNILTEEVTTYYPMRYGKGGWNCPDILYWLDIQIPDVDGKPEQTTVASEKQPPTTLTPELLEHNGFEKVSQPGCSNPYYWKLEQRDENDDVLYTIKAFKTPFRGMLITINGNMDCEPVVFTKQLEFVRELQNAIRLCDIKLDLTVNYGD